MPAPTADVPARIDGSGPVLFARYAYGPNRLGLCGPDDAAALLGETSERGDERQIRELAQGFEGAFPYLQLIARANRIADPLDRRVVEAYWLGSALLEAVTPALLGESMRTRFRPRIGQPAWKWLQASVPAGAKPVHAFHVLDVFPKVGLMRSQEVDRVLQVMDNCRIRWGRVQQIMGDTLVVRAVPLQLVDGKLTLGPPRVEHISGSRGGIGFLGDPAPGDVVSIHWDWACDVLTPDQLQRLVGWTIRELAIANQTI